MGSKVKFAFKKIAIKMAILVLLVVVLCGVGYYFLQGEFFDLMQVSLLLLSNIYGMCVLVVLVSYGLVFVPVGLWKKGDA